MKIEVKQQQSLHGAFRVKERSQKPTQYPYEIHTKGHLNVKKKSATLPSPKYYKYRGLTITKTSIYPQPETINIYFKIDNTPKWRRAIYLI